MDAVWRLLETMRDQHAWGVFLAKNTTCEEFSDVAEAIRKQEKQQLLAGFFDQGNFQEASSVFEKMSENEKLRLLSTLRREEIDPWLTTREREQTYWANQDMRWSYNERRYKKLLQYHPGGLLLYLYGNSGQVEHLFDLFRKVFEAIAEQGVNAEERGYLSGIVRRVDEQYYTDEWAKCCLLLYKKELLQKPPLCLQRLFFRHPDKMKMFLEENPSRSFDVENDYYLPEEAYQDKRAFDCWAECLYEEFPEILGYIMGRSCNGKDGAFPHEFIREFLEKQQNEKLTKAVFYGKFNSRGARIVQDGRTLYEQAKCYRAQARELRLKFPQSAKILLQLAKWMESEAQHDQLEAEIVP